MTVTSTPNAVRYDLTIKNLNNRLDELGGAVNESLIIDDLTDDEQLNALDKRQFLVVGSVDKIPVVVGQLDPYSGLTSNVSVSQIQYNLGQLIPKYLKRNLKLIS